jgi:drug/metabolite transporter (DMT)-like permease
MPQSGTPTRGARFDANDLGLLCVVVFWGLNLTVVKFALEEMRPLAFNAARFSLAAVTLLALLRARGESFATSRRDLVTLIASGILGHTAYQLFFIEGIVRTTASHAALIFGVSPVVVAILSLLLGHERILPAAWAGAAFAFGGVYIIIAGKAPGTGPAPSPLGDLLVLVAAVCWCGYTVMARPLLARHSPLKVTALSMGWGVLVMLPFCAPSIARQEWGGVSGWSWLAMIYSYLFALVIAYILWYRSVKLVGNVRTAVYSNLVPVTGTIAGWAFLGERLYPALGLGAAAIFLGIVLTRMKAAEGEGARGSGGVVAAVEIGEEF